MTTAPQRVGSGGPYEDVVGYSRVVFAEPFAFVAGCTAIRRWRRAARRRSVRADDHAFGVAEQALQAVGLELADVVQTRMYVVDIAHQHEVGRAHRLVFDQVRPAATMVGVAALVDPLMLVEVEVVAYRTGGLPR